MKYKPDPPTFGLVCAGDISGDVGDIEGITNWTHPRESARSASTRTSTAGAAR